MRSIISAKPDADFAEPRRSRSRTSEAAAWLSDDAASRIAFEADCPLPALCSADSRVASFTLRMASAIARWERGETL